MNRKLLFLLLSLWLICGLSVSSAGVENGLIGYWPLNGDALDYSGNNNHGMVTFRAHLTQNPTGDCLVLQNVRGSANVGHVRVGLPFSYSPEHQEVGYEGSGAFWVMFDDDVPLPASSDKIQYLLANFPGMLYVERVLDVDSIRTQVQRIERTDGSTRYWPSSSPSAVKDESVWYHVAWTFHSHDDGGRSADFRT